MIKVKKDNKRKDEEAAQKAKDEANGVVVKQKRSAAEIRLQGEIQELDLPKHAKAIFNPDDLTKFTVTIDLRNEPCWWQYGIYEFSIEIGKNYPYDAPKCHCNTQIYHPNIDIDGNVCLNILRADWKPVLGINAVILGLIFLFIEPNATDPLNHEAAGLMRDSEADFKAKVKRTLRGGNHEKKEFQKFI